MPSIPELVTLSSSSSRHGRLRSRLMTDRSRCGVEGAFGGYRRPDPGDLG